MKYARLLVIAATSSLLLSSCSTLQKDADTEAARVADHVLPYELTKALTTSSDTQTRARTAEKWLSTPDRAITRTYGGTWVLRSHEGAVFRVDTYFSYESGSIFPPITDAGRGESPAEHTT